MRLVNYWSDIYSLNFKKYLRIKVYSLWSIDCEPIFTREAFFLRATNSRIPIPHTIQRPRKLACNQLSSSSSPSEMLYKNFGSDAIRGRCNSKSANESFLDIADGCMLPETSFVSFG